MSVGRATAAVLVPAAVWAATLACARAPEAGPAASTGGKDATCARPAGLGRVQLRGRWDRRPHRAVTVNAGSHLSAEFTGAAIVACFDTSGDRDPLPTLAWQIDGGDWQEDEVASQVTLARGLPAGRHRVLLMARGLDETQGRWTPPLAASLAFLGFEVTEGALQPSPRGAGLEIEFLGDSVTEGVAVLPPRAGRDSRAWRADARLAYPCQTALRLGAAWRQVGFGRQGITVGGSGGVPRAADAFAWIYAGVPRDDWQPDLVVVNQGTNDRDAPAAEFRRGYERYLATIRSGYPRAGIAALRPFGGAQAAEIRAAVEARNATGDHGVFFVDTTGWLAASDLTDGTHPNAEGSRKIAERLAVELRKRR